MLMIGSQLHITLLGECSLFYNGKPAFSFNGDRPISLLTYLLLNRHTAVSRQHLTKHKHSSVLQDSGGHWQGSSKQSRSTASCHLSGLLVKFATDKKCVKESEW
jgi:hypothetical protein